MKRNIFYLLTVSLFALLTTVSCEKNPEGTFTEKNTFNVPVVVAPENKAAIAPATTATLQWSATGGKTDNWDVYYGVKGNVKLYKAGHTSQSITVPVVPGNEYFWYVATEDENGVPSESPEFSFKVKVALNIDNFVGTYDVDEPGYMHYDVHATKVNGNTIQIDNFWDSGWPLDYTFDEYGNVEIVETTFPMSSTVTYVVSGSGTYDAETSGFVVDYVVKKNVYTLKYTGNTVVTTTADDNTHTFVKK